MYDEEVYGGYDEDSAVKEIDGITDKVTDLSFTNLSYPAIVFNDGIQLPKHKVVAISNMVKSSAGNAVKDISLYFQNEGNIFKMGMLSGNQIMPLIDVVGVDSIKGFYMDGTPLVGNRIYVLCNFSY